MTMKKKLISLLLVVALVAGLLPATALAADAVVHIGGVGLAVGDYYVNGASAAVTEQPANWNAHLTETSDGYTLTIRNLSAQGVADNSSPAAIYSSVDLTIKLEGANSLTGADATTQDAKSCGIYSTGALTITGNGVLSATGGKSTSGMSYGIYADVALKITGGATVSANGGQASGSYGICGTTVAIIGDDTARPTVNAAGAGGGGGSFGIYTNMTEKTGNSVHIENATVNATAGNANFNSFGILVDAGTTSDYSVYIKNAIVNATAGTASSYSYGIQGTTGTTYSIYITGDDTVVNAVAGTAGTTSAGLGSTAGNPTVTINGGVVVATGGARTKTGGGNNEGSFGIDGNATVTGGVVIARSSTSTMKRAAIESLNLSNGATKIAGATANGTSLETAPTPANVGSYRALVVVPSSWTQTSMSGGGGRYSLNGDTYIVNANASAFNPQTNGGVTIDTTDNDYTLLAVSLYEGVDSSYGLDLYANISTFTGKGKVIAVGGTSTTWTSYGIAAQSVTNNIDLIGIGGASAYSRGVYAATNGIANSAGSAIIGIGGPAANDSSGVQGYVGENIDSGITGIGGTSTGGSSYGVDSGRGFDGESILKNTGTITGIGGSAAKDSYGVCSDAPIGNGMYIIEKEEDVFETVVDTDATLTAIAGASTGGNSVGVYTEAAVTNYATLTALGGTSACANGYSSGVFADCPDDGADGSGSITNSGTLTGIAGNAEGASSESSGVYAGYDPDVEDSGIITNTGTLTGNGGEAGRISYGVYSCGTITNGEATATYDAANPAPALTGTGGTADYSYGVYGDKEGDGSITNYAKLTGNGGDATNSSTGVYSGSELTNTGTVTGNGGKVTTDTNTGTSIGVSCSAITNGKENGSVTATITGTGGKATGTPANSYGIRSQGTFTNHKGAIIEGTGDTATGSGEGNAESIGVIAAETAEVINHGTMTAKGGTATGTNAYSYGISGVLKNDSADLTAEGNTYGLYYTGNMADPKSLSAGTFKSSTGKAIGLYLPDTVTHLGLLAGENYGYYDDAEPPKAVDKPEDTAFLQILATYTVSFKYNGLGGTDYTDTVLAGNTAAEPTVDVPAGYAFDGWYTSTDGGTTLSDTAYVFTTEVTSDITLYAKWTKLHTVTFDASHDLPTGTKVTDEPAKVENVRDGDTIPAPTTTPTTASHNFVAWYEDAELTKAVNFDTYTIEEDVTLYADWEIKTYTVTFDANGHGTAPASQTVNHGSTVAEPTDPTVDGYTFGGWYTDADCTTAYDFSTSVTGTLTLFAKWTEAEDKGDNTTTGGGGGSPSTYPPTITQPEHGRIRTTPTYPQAGDEVTITVIPDEGYETTEVTVTDRNGNPVDVTDNGDGTYTFEQPRGSVTITAELAPTDEPTDDPTNDHIYCPQDDTCPIAKFEDADPTAWYHDAVHYCIENGLMNGTSDTEFEPHEPTTRAMLVTILHRMAGTPAPTTTGTFTDVPDGMWYTDAIDWAASRGIILGHGDGTFEPDSNLTREQMATILYRCVQLLGIDVSIGEDTILNFTDADEISDWAYPALQWACAVGLFEGDGDGTLRPGDDLERCEMATLIYRICETILK